MRLGPFRVNLLPNWNWDEQAFQGLTDANLQGRLGSQRLNHQQCSSNRFRPNHIFGDGRNCILLDYQSVMEILYLQMP